MKRKDFKVSPYLYLLQGAEMGYFAYNGANNSFMKLNFDLYDCLKKAQENNNVLNELNDEIFQKLVETNIICTEEYIHFLISQKKFLRTKNDFQHDYFALVIAPTTACNFSCPYCFEKGINHKTMDDSTIEKTVKFIEKHSKLTNNKVNITWYGGEPLLAINKMQNIYKEIKDKGIEIIDSSIVTNGYYLNNKNQAILNDIRVSSIQITLDGASPESHNKRRFISNGTGSWNIILKNIDSLLNKNYDIQINIRCNIDKNNKNEFVVLKNELENRWNNNKNVNIYAALLRDHNVDNNLACNFFSNKEASDYMIQNGVATKELPYFEYTIGGCTATMLNSYLIGPEGELYKCWNDLGRTDRIIGKIDDEDSINQELLLKYMVSPSAFEDIECKQCKLFFVCEGGCQWDRLKEINSGKPKNSCHIAKNNMGKYLKEYLKLKLTDDEV